MYTKLLFVLLCLVIASMLIGGSALPVYADGGEGHGNSGDKGGGPGGKDKVIIRTLTIAPAETIG